MLKKISKSPEDDSVFKKFLMKFLEKILGFNSSVSLFIIIIQTLYATCDRFCNKFMK